MASAASGITGCLNSATATKETVTTTGGATLDSMTGAGCELLIAQQDGGTFALSSLPCWCSRYSAIIGHAGGHCIEFNEPAECGVQSASESDGVNSAISNKLAETILYPIRILFSFTLFI